MNIIIHNGHGKTGSSSIQSSLNVNKEILNNNKIFYVGLNFEYSPFKKYAWQKPYGWPLLIELTQKEINNQLYEVLHNTINQLTELEYNTIIWSNESLFTAVSSLTSVLDLISKEHNVLAITYLRRHDRWVDSAYKQWGIKHKAEKGVVIPFSTWSSKNIAYSSLLDTWSCIEGIELKVMNFDESKDVCTSFFKNINIDSQNLKFIRSNESPTPEILSMYALYNSLFDEAVLPSQLDPLIKKYELKNLKSHGVDLNTIFPCQDELEAILEKYSDDIDKVNSFFSLSNQAHFDKNFVKKDAARKVSSDQIISMLIHVVNEQTKEISELSSMYKELADKVGKIGNN